MLTDPNVHGRIHIPIFVLFGFVLSAIQRTIVTSNAIPTAVEIVRHDVYEVKVPLNLKRLTIKHKIKSYFLAATCKFLRLRIPPQFDA
jgi:hypothetical protein